MAGTTSPTRTTTPTLASGMTTAKSYAAEYKEKQREEAKLSGICRRCLKRKAIINRSQCELCQMKSIISEVFKYDPCREKPMSSLARGACYVDQFNARSRKKIISEIIASYDGTCYYTGIPIEIGVTAGLVFKIPRAHIHTYGADKIFCSSNLCWCHQSIHALKGSKTDADFRKWLIDSFLKKLITEQGHANNS